VGLNFCWIFCFFVFGKGLLGVGVFFLTCIFVFIGGGFAGF